MNELLLTTINKDELSDLITDSIRKVLEENRSTIPAYPLNSPSGNNGEEFMSIDEVSILINLAKATIYSLCSAAKIPHIKKGKRLYFLKGEIISWLNEGKRKTIQQIQEEADNYLLRKRRIG